MYSQTLLSPMSTNSIGVICDKISTILHYWMESLLQAIKGNVLLSKFEITAFNCIYIILYSYVRICYFSLIRIGKKNLSYYFFWRCLFINEMDVVTFRDRPFNLKGRGVMVFCFVQKKISGQHKSQNINFFCRTKRNFFFQN